MKKKDTPQTEPIHFAQDPFLPLRDLLAAPLEALAEADAQLRDQILDLIEASGTRIKDPETGESLLHVDTFNFLFEQLKNNGDSGQTLEEVLLRVPRLSLLPPSGLKVKRTLIRFDAEIRSVVKTDKLDQGKKQYLLEARVCPPKGKRARHLPTMHFEMEIASTKQPEGLARVIDILNTSAIPKEYAITPINETGEPAGEQERAVFAEKRDLRMHAAHLARLSETLDCTDEAIQAELSAAREKLAACERALLRKELQAVVAQIGRMEAQTDETRG